MIGTQTIGTNSLSNDLTDLLLSAEIVDRRQFDAVSNKAKESGVLIGQALMINQLVTSGQLLAALVAVQLMRDGHANKAMAVDALKLAAAKSITIEQALFEKGQFKPPPQGAFKLAELLRMAGFISENDLIHCMEMELFQDKNFLEAVKTLGMADQHLLDAAYMIQAAIAAGELKPYQAVDALRRSQTTGEPVDDVIDSICDSDKYVKVPTLGDLLIEAQVVQRVDLARTSGETNNIKIGKLLLQAGSISKPLLHRALRCHSLVKYGVVSRIQAIHALKACKRENISPEQSFLNLGLCVPSRMQWSWV